MIEAWLWERKDEWETVILQLSRIIACKENAGIDGQKKFIHRAIIVTISFFSIASTNALAKLINGTLSTPQILFVQYAISFCLILPFSFIQENALKR